MNLKNPEHVAIIMDGNRRFAKRLMLEPWKGHEYGRKKVEELLDYAKDFGIKEMTFYALSIENIKNRPNMELSLIYKVFRETFKNLNREKIEKNKIRMRFIGDLSLLPDDLREQCLNLENETKNNDELNVNFAIAYGGRQELVEAVRSILKNKIEADEVDGKLIERHLYMDSQPDFIIRTGGEKRTSNFLPWQSVYSELFFTDTYWPDFSKEEFNNILEQFSDRERRRGK